MNVKSLMLLLAFAGLGASCSNDDVDGGGGSHIAGRTELQIAFSGNGESQEYTKATASESENEIKDLKIYLFAASAENGEYQYLETWEEGQAYDPANKDVTKFKKQASGTSVKASIYPNEKKGLPWIKLYCVANNGSHLTTDGRFYTEDGTTEMLATLTPVETDADGTITTPGTTETDFIKSFTKAIGTDADTGILGTPLLMTGNGKTKISGSVSKVDIILRRLVARFDIDNAASKTNLTITSLTMAHARKTAPLWGAAPTKVEESDLATDAKLTTYKDVEFNKIEGANTGLTESAFYAYPNLTTDQSYLIIKGTYKSPITSAQVPVTYNIPIVRTPENADKGEYIAINANNRYKLRISDVTQSNVFASFEVVDWTSGGGIIVKPDNDAPVFDKTVAFDGANAPTELTALTTETAPYNYEVTGDADGNGNFDVTIAATGKVRAEKGAVTKADDPTSWLTIGNTTYEEKEGVWYTKFNISYTGSIGQQPVAVTFINESASYDPALWTTVNFYGPKAVPTFAVVADGNSKGNKTDATDPKAPTATIYSVNGSYIQFNITSIEGVEADLTTAAGYKSEKVKTDGFVHTYKISVSDEDAAKGGKITFKNAGDPTKTTDLTITKADPNLVVSKTTDANSAGDYVAGSETPYIKTGTLQIDLDLLASGTCNFKIDAPQGATVASLNCPWLNIEETHAWNESEPWLEYSIAKKEGATNTDDFNLVFTNGLNEQGISAPGFTLKLNKAFSKPQILPNADPSTYVNSSFNTDAPSGYPYQVLANMYKTDNSTIYLQIDCPENITVTSSDANVSVEKQGSTKYYKIMVTSAAAVADEVTITAKNDNDTNRKATITLTLLDPSIKMENPGGTVTPELSDKIITIPSSYAAFSVSTFDIVAPEGSKINCEASTWFSCTPASEITVDATKKQTITLMGTSPQPGDTPNVTITVHNSITNADETITVKKATAP